MNVRVSDTRAASRLVQALTRPGVSVGVVADSFQEARLSLDSIKGEYADVQTHLDYLSVRSEGFSATAIPREFLDRGYRFDFLIMIEPEFEKKDRQRKPLLGKVRAI